MDIDNIAFAMLPEPLSVMVKTLPEENRLAVVNAYLNYVVKHYIPLDWPLCPCYFMGDENPFEHHLGYYIGGFTHNYIMDPESPEYNEVADGFIADMPEKKITMMVKNINPVHLKRYDTKANDLETNFQTPRDEKYVYHSSHMDNMLDIMKKGLDIRMGQGGNFGVGIYGAERPRKADAYWRGGAPDSARCMYRLKMNIGNCLTFPVGAHNHEMPCLPDGIHSVLGNINGFNEYVVYDNSQVCIEYTIYYCDRERELVTNPRHGNVNMDQKLTSTPYNKKVNTVDVDNKRIGSPTPFLRRSQRIAEARGRSSPY